MHSELCTVVNLSPNYTKKRNHEIDTLTIHCFVGQVTAKSGLAARSFQKYDPINGASCNYVVGHDGSIGCGVEEESRSWCSSNRANDMRAITFECASDTKYPYAITDRCYKALIELLVDICKRHKKDTLVWVPEKDNMLMYEPAANEFKLTVHRWFANKECPGDYIYERLGQICKEVNEIMKSSKAPDYDKASDWAKPAWEKVYEAGFMDGTRPRDPLTREEMAQVLLNIGVVK